jgi:hypothetical protein
MSNTAFNAPLVHARSNAYPYRQGFAMTPSWEQVVFFDEFTQKVTTNVPTGWEAAIIDTGATVVQLATDAYPGGVLKIASDGTSEGATIYLPKQIQLSGKKFYMEVRIQTNLVAETAVQFGLSALTATTNPEDVWTTTATDVIAFGTLAGDATVTMLVDKNNGGTAAQLGSVDLVNATWHTLAILVDGSETNGSMSVRGYVDGNLALTWSGASTTVPGDLVLAPFIGGLTGATAANTIYIDYVRFAAMR